MCGEEAAEVADDCFEEVGVGGWLGTGVVEFEVRYVQEVRGRRVGGDEKGRRKEDGEGEKKEGKSGKVGRTYGRHRESKIPHKPKGVFEIVVEPHYVHRIERVEERYAPSVESISVALGGKEGTSQKRTYPKNPPKQPTAHHAGKHASYIPS